MDTPTFKEWLDTSVRDRFVSYQSASDWCKAYPVKTMAEYRTLSKQHKLPAKFPLSPQIVYLGRGWSDWFAFLGKVRGMWSYEECTQYIMSLPAAERPTNKAEYQLLARKTTNLPVAPRYVFGVKFKTLGGMPAFLGTPRAPSWEALCNELVPHVKNGSCRLPRDTRLGMWWHNQKSIYRQGKMRSDRLNRLEEIGVLGDM